MRTLTFTRPHRLGKIADELLAGVPALRATANAAGELVARSAVSGDGATLTLSVPDAAPDAAIAAVVAAHDPTTPSATDTRDAARQAHESAFGTELQALLVKLDAGTATASDQRRVAALLVRIVLRLLD